MYIEYACYEEYDQASVHQKVFRAIDLGVAGISTHCIFIPELIKFLPPAIVVSTPIDYPYGLGDSQFKSYSIMRAIRKGAGSVDVVVSNKLLIESKFEQFIDEVCSLQRLCVDHNITMRVMLNSMIINNGQFRSACAIMKHADIQYAFASIGGFPPDDYVDNLIACDEISSRYHINAIVNGNFHLKEHYQTILDSKLFGVRFNNIHTLQRCVGV